MGQLSRMAATLLLALPVALAGCGISGTEPALTSIAVGPPAATAAKGVTIAFTATGIYSDGTRRALTADVTWSATSASVAAFSAATGTSGVATALSPGSTTITATMGNVSGATTLTVTAATLVSIGVTPTKLTLARGLAHQFAATGVYTDNSTHDLTSVAMWSSAAPGTASIATSETRGLAVMVGTGSTRITASLASISGAAQVTVTPATLASIGVTPASLSLAAGSTQPFTATGVYTDNSTHDLTASVVWSSTAASVATVSNASGTQGLASTVQPGSTTVTAASSGLSGTAKLTVTPVALETIDVTPANLNLAVGLNRQFTATGVYSDRSVQNLSSSVVWNSSAQSVATISNATGFTGLATPVGPGSTTITATSGTVSGSTTLVITPAALVSIEVTPAGSSIADGTNLQFTATGVYSDNSLADLTAQATWSAAITGIASISNAAGSQGFATALGPGSTAVTAAFAGVSGSTTLTVSSLELVSLAITPANPSIASDTSEQFKAIGTFSDSSTQDLTGSATWTSSAPAVASVSNVPGFNGSALALGQGTAVITAAVNGISATTTLTVTPAPLVSIAVSPANASIPNGTGQQYTATGNYADGSMQDLTTSATWRIADSGAASISNASGSQGLLESLGPGSTTVTATLGSVSGTTNLTVTAATLVSLAVSPSVVSLFEGGQRQFIAIGTYSDHSTQTLTPAVAWSSSDPSVASISNAAGSNGLASAASLGTTSISAAVQSVSSPSATLTVAANPEYAYVANTYDNDVSQYTVGAGGTLTALSPAIVSTGNGPESVSVDPSGGYAYVANSVDGTISQFTIGSGGALAPMTPAVVTAGNYPQAVTVDPTGRFAYAANSGDDTVSQFVIGAGGALAAMNPATVPAGIGPQSLSIDPSGRFLYAANSYDGTVSQYVIGPAGALVAMSPASVPAGNGPQCLTVDPSGRYVYVVNGIDGSVSQFTIGGDGALSAMNPPSVPAGDLPTSIAIDPSGHHVYVTNSADDTVSEYSVGTGGALFAMNPATVPAGDDPQSVTVDVTGQYVYVANETDDTVWQYTIGPGGVLTLANTAGVATGSGPYAIVTAD